MLFQCVFAREVTGLARGAVLSTTLSEFEIGILTDLVNDLGLGKEMRRTKGKGEIAKHFRKQYQLMREKREEGVLGRLDFEDYV